MAKNIILQLKETMDASAVVMLIFTPGYGEDLKSCAELGMAMMMDKPILVLKHKDKEMNNTLKRVARDWEEWGDEESMHTATEKLLSRNSGLFEEGRTYSGKPFIPKPDEPSKN